MSLIISSYDKYIKRNKVNSKNDDIHDHFYKKLLNNNPKLMYQKESELSKYKMDKITYSKPIYDKYSMQIELYPKFKNQNIKLNENENYNASKKYDGVVDDLVKNKIPSSYYQYKLEDKNSSQMLINNLETSENIPNELNLLRLNQETGYTIPELKRDNIDRQNALNLVLDNYLNKKNNYTSKTTDETKEKDIKYKDKKVLGINSTPYYTTPSTLNKKKMIINPAGNVSPVSINASSVVENQAKKQITNIERKRQKPNESKNKIIINPVVNTTPVTMVNDPVTLITEPLIKSVSATLESEVIEENKTSTKKMKKPVKSHKESRQQIQGETNFDFEKRIKALDRAVEQRASTKKEKAELIKTIEAETDEYLKSLNEDTNKGTKL